MKADKSLDHLFRHEYGKIVSALTYKYSTKLIDLIEDSVQEALLKATLLWAYKEIPQNPSGWLFRVANNHLIDQLRKAKKSDPIENFDQLMISGKEIDEEYLTSGLNDELLKMIFACAHPELTKTEQIILCLKLVNGFSLTEISNALLKKEEAVKKATTRAKIKFKTKIGKLEVPPINELSNRLNVVLKVIYLIFNEGYKSTNGSELVKKDICEEAIRLAKIIDDHKDCKSPELTALISLMYFNSARFDARVNEKGELVTLEHQDRNRWKIEYLKLGTKYLNLASRGKTISKYHIEAGIASEYCTTPSFDKINWNFILSLYDLLIKIDSNPFVRLNRIVVLEKVAGPQNALNALSELEDDKNLQKSYLLYSIKADLIINLNGDLKMAGELINKAISLTSNSIERNFLKKKFNNLRKLNT